MTSPQQQHLAAVSIQDSAEALSDGFLVDRCDYFLEAHLTLLRQLFDIIKLLIFFWQRNLDDKNDSVEARQNLNGSG